MEQCPLTWENVQNLLLDSTEDTREAEKLPSIIECWLLDSTMDAREGPLNSKPWELPLEMVEVPTVACHEEETRSEMSFACTEESSSGSPDSATCSLSQQPSLFGCGVSTGSAEVMFQRELDDAAMCWDFECTPQGEEQLWCAQTPQLAEVELMQECLERYSPGTSLPEEV